MFTGVCRIDTAGLAGGTPGTDRPKYKKKLVTLNFQPKIFWVHEIFIPAECVCDSFCIRAALAAAFISIPPFSYSSSSKNDIPPVSLRSVTGPT